MTAQKDITREIEAIIAPSLEAMGYSLVRTQIGAGRRPVLQIMAERRDEQPMTVDDCADISRAVSALLDVEDPIPSAFTLEVSSPGLDRPLRTLAAVERFAGQRAVLTTRETYEGRRNYEGVLLAPRDGQAGVRTDEGNEYWFGWADIKDAHLKIDPWSRLRGAGDGRPDGGLR